MTVEIRVIVTVGAAGSNAQAGGRHYRHHHRHGDCCSRLLVVFGFQVLFVGCMCYHDIDGTVTLFIVWVFLSSCLGGDKRLS